jgi:hypothetical protein
MEGGCVSERLIKRGGREGKKGWDEGVVSKWGERVDRGMRMGEGAPADR